jgi:hypothetical protein
MNKIYNYGGYDLNNLNYQYVLCYPYPIIHDYDVNKSLPTDPENCIKCGSNNIITVYHESSRKCGYNSFNKKSKEHLHYTCKNCNYDWTGSTLEQLTNVEKPEVNEK